MTTTATAVASWAAKLKNATLRRDEAIRAMRAEGASLRAIARVADMTGPGVAKVLKRGEVLSEAS